MYGTFPFAIGITTGETTISLMRSRLGIKLSVNFPVFFFPFVSGFFFAGPVVEPEQIESCYS